VNSWVCVHLDARPVGRGDRWARGELGCNPTRGVTHSSTRRAYNGAQKKKKGIQYPPFGEGNRICALKCGRHQHQSVYASGRHIQFTMRRPRSRLRSRQLQPPWRADSPKRTFCQAIQFLSSAAICMLWSVSFSHTYTRARAPHLSHPQTHMHTYTRTHKHTHIHTHTPTYTYTHTHTRWASG